MSRWTRALLGATAPALLTLSPGCASVQPSPSVTKELWPPPDTSVGISSPTLRQLVEDTWTFTLSDQPLFATRLGIHRFDDRVEDNAPAGIARRRLVRKNLLERADAMVSEVKGDDALVLEVFRAWLSGESGSDVCDLELWAISPRSNPVTEWSYLPTLHQVESELDAKNLLARYELVAESIDGEIANLRTGMSRGLLTNRRTAQLVLEVFEKALAQPIAEWPMMAPALEPKPSEAKGFAIEPQTREKLAESLKNQIRPAFERYAAFLEKELIPAARGEDAIGVSSNPDGAACYASQIRRFLGSDRSAEELHALGLAEIARLDREIERLGKEALGVSTLPETLAKLRSDPSLYFRTSDEVEAKAKTSLDRARAKIPEVFGILPKADCVVTRIPDYEAPFTTVAYYRQPVPDGSKPGEYFINVYAPATRTRYEAEALAYHESIPGHHLQIAIAQERSDLPAFRRHYGLDAYVEGWGLYAERLADEMGLYSTPVDRIGMYSYEAWRAARLVVDTGIHAKGWTRKQAVEFMLAHTALAENNVVNEVERYVTWPGQALAYKVGQLEILRLRELAKAELGPKFDLRAFHDRVLETGAVPLPTLTDRVRAWIDRSK
ncbi:MAG: DUF885 domain-containing protein [Deltaproteobacteria bacterium]|nr:DUF885 domain-containing protein [Deltaproteobacteria bacterium]